MNEFLKKPTSDFGAIRDGRQTLPFYVDIDLTTAHSIAGGNPLIISVAGNSFYSDADTTNGGNAVVHFQDTTFGIISAPFFVSPGFIANVGFTQLLIENTAQAGKRCRIFYGVDIDFQAGVNSSISISGAVSVTSGVINTRPEAGSVSYADSSLMAANTPVTVLAPASNTNGLIVTQGNIASISSGQPGFPTLIAKASAPTSISDGRVIFSVESGLVAAYGVAGKLGKDIYVPAGFGLYFITNVAEGTAALHSCSYKLL